MPVAGVSTLDAFAGGRPVIDARRGEVFTDGPAVARPEELDVAGAGSSATAPSATASVFEARGADVPPDDDPAHLPSAHLLAAHAASFGPADEVEPLYVRSPTRGRAR